MKYCIKFWLKLHDSSSNTFLKKVYNYCNKAIELHLVIDMDIFARNYFKNFGLMLCCKNSFFFMSDNY